VYTLQAKIQPSTHKTYILDSVITEKAQEVFKQYGIGLSDAFNIFLAQTVLERGIPFQIKIPNDETKQAIKTQEQASTCPKYRLKI
jgi:DNA-damage-inducible protein J